MISITEQVFTRIEEILFVHGIANNVANIDKKGTGIFIVDYNLRHGGRAKITLEITPHDGALWGHFLNLLQVAGTNTSKPHEDSASDIRPLWFPLS